MIRPAVAAALVVSLGACHHPPPSPPAPPAPAPFAIANLTISGAPPIDRALYAELARAADADREVALVDVAPAGGAILARVAGQLVARDAAGRDRALPFDPALDVAQAMYLADGSVLLVAATGGDERARFYRQTVATAPVPVGADASITAVVADRARNAFAWARRTGSDSEIVVGDPLAATGGQVVQRGPGWLPLDISADGAQVLALQVASDHAAVLARIDVASASATALTPPDANVLAARFAGDDTIVAITDAGQRDGEPRAVRLHWRGAGEPVDTAPEATALALAPDGTVAVVTGNVFSELAVIRPDGSWRRRRVDGEIGNVAFAPDGAAVYFDEATPHTARAIRRWDLANPSPDPRPAGPPRFAFAAASIGTADGTSITALVARPQHAPGLAVAAARSPVVVELHGGPEDRFVAEHDPGVDALVLRGFAVVRPNVRGSTGYGRAFAALDDGPRRAAAIADVGAVLDWIATQPDLDRRRVVLAGRSYGGFLAMAAAIAYPARVRGAIDDSGIPDLAAFLATTRADRRDERRAEYGDERDPAMRAILDALSPGLHAGDLRVPLLVAHGANDPRVPIADVDRFVAAARAARLPVWYLRADDEGHGFARFDHQIARRALELQFLRQVTQRTP